MQTNQTMEFLASLDSTELLLWLPS